MIIYSTAFLNYSQIPTRYTCEGRNISPALGWTNLPRGAKSLALIVEDPDAPDPDAPSMTWAHWILYNLSPLSNGIPEGVAPEELPAGTLLGLNDWRYAGYGGPCPPMGRHRYVHRLLALDIVLPDLDVPDRLKLERAADGHILARAELVGMYQRRDQVQSPHRATHSRHASSLHAVQH
jgi:Raf kinase inhibitor-like YbhB/YbcL family protein